MQSCSSCALGTMSHCPKKSLRFKPLLKETVLKFSWISSALLSGSSLLVSQLCCGHFRWISWSLHRHILCCMLPSRCWGQRGGLSLRSHGLASDGYVQWSHLTAQRTKTCGPLHESLASPWTLSWGHLQAWGPFPPLLLPPSVQIYELLLPLCSAPHCCHSSIFHSRLICYKHQPRNPRILSTLSEEAAV